MSVPLGQRVRLYFQTYSDAAETVLADPTTVQIEVLEPDGTETVYTLAGGGVTRESLGVFYWEATPDQVGHHAYHWSTTGTVTTADDGSFEVRSKYDAQLISLADAKRHLDKSSVTDDDELQDMIDAATALLTTHPAYNIPVGRVEVENEIVLVNGGEAILANYPVIPGSVTVSEYNGTAVQSVAYEPVTGGAFTDYGWSFKDGTGQSGVILRTSSGYYATWSGTVVVSYTYGSASVPANVRQAALLLVEHMWDTQRGSQGPDAPQGLDVEDPHFAAQVSSYAIPRRVEELLAPYRRAPSIA